MLFTVDILTIENQEHRIHSLLGHLRTIGFPVNVWMIEQKEFNLLNGRSYLKHTTAEEVENGLLADGHEKFRDAKDDIQFQDKHWICWEWSMLNCLKHIAIQEKPSLLLENDAFFFGIDYEKIVAELLGLFDTVGYENINVVQFTVDRLPFEQHDPEIMSERPELNEFWAIGSRGQGATANFYTPHGARRLLEIKPKYPILEGYIFSHQDEIGGVYSTNDPCIDLHFYSNYDSPHTHNPQEVWDAFMKGIDL